MRKWKNDNAAKKGFTPETTLNQACGGFRRGEDAVIDMLFNRI